MNIRKANLNDSEFIATHLLLAMEDIVYTFINENNPQKAREFMLHFVQKENNQYSYQNCWVMEQEMKIIATVSLYNGAQLDELRQPVVEHIRNKYKSNFTPEDETQAGEHYIDCIGVSSEHRGKGIGSQILEFLINEYQGKTLGLLVHEDNPDAKRLYLKLGFKSVGTKMLFGKKMEHLQKAVKNIYIQK
jgi:ribosomal protein S18 acetylase RimI-like enzyme